MTPDTVLKRGREVRSRRIDDETVLVHLEAEEYYALGDVGTEAWARIDESGTSFRSLVDALVVIFDVDPERLTNDLQALLADMAAHQLVIVDPEPGPA